MQVDGESEQSHTLAPLVTKVNANTPLLPSRSECCLCVCACYNVPHAWLDSINGCYHSRTIASLAIDTPRSTILRIVLFPYLMYIMYYGTVNYTIT